MLVRLLDAEGRPVKDGLFRGALLLIAMFYNKRVEVLHLGEQLSLIVVMIFARLVI